MPNLFRKLPLGCMQTLSVSAIDLSSAIKFTKALNNDGLGGVDEEETKSKLQKASMLKITSS